MTMNTLKNILTLAGKELRSLLGDPILIILTLYMYTGVVIAMSQSNTDLKHAAVAVIDEDHSTLSYRIRDAILPPYFQPPVEIARDSADSHMDKGDYTFIIDIPPNYERDILQNRSPQAQLTIDATRMSQGGVGAAYLSQIHNREINRFLGRPDDASFLPIRPVLRTHYNPNSENAYQMPVAALGTATMLLFLLLIGAAVIREREHGTLEHLLVMPVTPPEIMLAKILANGVFILTTSTASLWFVVHITLGIPINGSIPLYIAGSAGYPFSTASPQLMTAHIPPPLQMRILLRHAIRLIPAHSLLHITVPTIQRRLQPGGSRLKIGLRVLRRSHAVIITIHLITRRHHTLSQKNSNTQNGHRKLNRSTRSARTDPPQEHASAEISRPLSRTMHRSAILSSSHKALELVKSSPSRTVHLTCQRLRGIIQIPHQNTEIFRLRLRPLSQINQRVALHRELHNNPLFLGLLNSSPATFA